MAQALHQALHKKVFPTVFERNQRTSCSLRDQILLLGPWLNPPSCTRSSVGASVPALHVSVKGSLGDYDVDMPVCQQSMSRYVTLHVQGAKRLPS